MARESTSGIVRPEEAEGHRAHAATIAGYLQRYPDISDDELIDLISGYRQLSNLDIAFMLSDPNVAPKLERFRAEHKRHTREPFGNYAVLLGLAVVGLALSVYSVLAVL